MVFDFRESLVVIAPWWDAHAADVAWRSVLLLALTAVAAWLLRYRSAAARHGVWTLGLIGILALP
ncbi:MAG TPA: hypothetical protein VL475_04890, partial [Planctomycetaceae bacterium]|nr:hypothetical protein [Planctomycetaceae bacterium]